MSKKGRSDIWQAKTVRRKKLLEGDRRASQRSVSLRRDLENGLKYFWANRPKPSHVK